MKEKFITAMEFILDALLPDGAMNKAFICVVFSFILSYLKIDIRENLIATSSVIMLFVVAMELAADRLREWREKQYRARHENLGE